MILYIIKKVDREKIDYISHSINEISFRNKIVKRVLINDSHLLKKEDEIYCKCDNCNNIYKFIFLNKINLLSDQKCKSCGIIRTNIERYGVSCVFKSEIIKSKIKSSCLISLGVDNAFKSKEVREKSKLTMINKYGVDHNSKSEELKLKVKKRDNNKTLNSNYIRIMKSNRISNVATPLFDSKSYFGVHKLYKWKCNTCYHEFYDKIINGDSPRCYKCYPIKNNKISFLEKEVVEYIKTLMIDLEENSREIIFPQELDIYIKSKNLAIEFNGTYWHSSEQKDKWYHQRKVELCSRLGIRLLHIYEWEWVNNRQDCLDKIDYYLNNEEMIFPRKPRPRFITKNKEVDRNNYDTLIWD